MIQPEAIREHLFGGKEKVDQLQLTAYSELMEVGTQQLSEKYQRILQACLASVNRSAIARVIAGVAVSRYNEDGPAQEWFKAINELLTSRDKLDCKQTAFGFGLTLGLFKAGVALDSYGAHDSNGFGRIFPEVVTNLVLCGRPFFPDFESRFGENNKHFLIQVSDAVKLWVNSYHMKGNLVYKSRYCDVGRIFMLVFKEIRVGCSIDQIFDPSFHISGLSSFGKWLMKQLYYALASRMTSAGMVLTLATLFKRMDLDFSPR